MPLLGILVTPSDAKPWPGKYLSRSISLGRTKPQMLQSLNMQKYSLGFVFDLPVEKVLLIDKQRPEWQKGKLNGIGGKIEAGETDEACMVREAFEECGLQTRTADWIRFAVLKHKEWQVSVFAAVHFGDHLSLYSKTDEEVMWIDPMRIPPNTIANVSWLVPLAKDVLQNRDVKEVVVQY